MSQPPKNNPTIPSRLSLFGLIVVLGCCVFTSARGSLAGLSPRELTQAYSARAGINSPTGNENTFQFVDGLARLGVLTNLVDFAFFTADQNALPDGIVSLNNSGVVMGAVTRLKGGLAFQNFTNNYGLYFTNLPATPNGRTIVVWAAPAYGKNASNNVNNVVFELTGAGGPLYTPNPALSFVYLGGANPNPYLYNGSVQVIGPAYVRWAANSLLVAAISSDSQSASYTYSTDYPKETFTWATPHPVSASPTVLRLAYRHTLSNPTCGWPGLIRGFAYFDRALTAAEIHELNKLVPRIGVIFEGDSKTIGNDWPSHYQEGSNTWGLYSTLTNSAVGGTLVAAANSIGPNSMQDRWPANSGFRTNSQYPRILYHLRGGHNDFSGPGVASASNMTNAFRAITNLWSLARSNGFTTVGWTIDRTASTYTGVNTNYLPLINNWIRDHRHLCNELFDAEAWFVTQFGNIPFTNYSIYEYSPDNPVHETPLGALLLGQAVSVACSPSLPQPPLRMAISSVGQARIRIEVTGFPEGKQAALEHSSNLRDWSVLDHFQPAGGYFCFTNYSTTLEPQQFFRVKGE